MPALPYLSSSHLRCADAVRADRHLTRPLYKALDIAVAEVEVSRPGFGGRVRVGLVPLSIADSLQIAIERDAMQLMAVARLHSIGTACWAVCCKSFGQRTTCDEDG